MTQFLPYIQNLRGVAILYVVSVHAKGYDSNWYSNPEINNLLDVFFDPSEGNGTVMFLFIGGFLFQHLTHKSFEFRKYLQQKFKVIILPYLLISVPLIAMRIHTDFVSLSLPADFHERSLAYQILYCLFTGIHMAPFWFIATIILIYLTAPLLHALDNARFYNFIFPFLLLACLFTYRPENNANPFLAYVHYLPVYILGMWASFNRDKILPLGNKLLFPLATIYFLLCLSEVLGWNNVSRALTFEDVLYHRQLVFNPYILKAIVLCLGLMMLFYHLRNKQMAWLELLASYSFGIYFVHYMVISLSRHLVPFKNVIDDFSLLSYAIYFLTIVLASVIMVSALKKVTGRYSRFVIGS